MTAAKKLENAKQLVITNPVAFDSVGELYTKLHPCKNLISFKTDTVDHHDTTQTLYHYTDTVKHTDTVVKTITITNTKIIHDTATVIDGQQIGILTDQLNAKNIQIANMNGQIIQASQATAAEKKRADKFLYYLIAIAIIVAGVSAYKLFKSLTPAGAATSAGSSILSSIKNIFK